MLINYFIIVLFGVLSGMFFISVLRKFTLSHKILIPHGIPLIGGVGMGISFVLAALFGLLFFRGFSREGIGIIVSASIMLIFGLVDDFKRLSVMNKFFIQIIAITFLIFFGVRTQIVYIGDLANLVITFVWILAITNAFNLLDIADGLSAGCGIIASSAFFVVSLLNGDMVTAILSLALAAATLSCFIYNLPPARVYMGNTGSHFLGFSLAAIALAISYAPLGRKVALISPLLILGFPIFDTAFLILMRVSKGRPIFKKSNDHLALRFLSLGYSKSKTLLFMLALSLFFTLCGLSLSQVSNIPGIIIIVSVVIIAVTLTRRMGRVSVES
ncbi:MAG: MraY family glycosyltransferase [Candidatus Omnitrophota bacterium]